MPWAGTMGIRPSAGERGTEVWDGGVGPDFPTTQNRGFVRSDGPNPELEQK